RRDDEHETDRDLRGLDPVSARGCMREDDCAEKTAEPRRRGVHLTNLSREPGGEVPVSGLRESGHEPLPSDGARVGAEGLHRGLTGPSTLPTWRRPPCPIIPLAKLCETKG